MYAPNSALPVGLIEQQRWSRTTDTYSVKHQRKERPYEEKESYRWQRFVGRAAQNRRPEVLATAGSHTLNVMQKRGGEGYRWRRSSTAG